jgi:hypothetical protein
MRLKEVNRKRRRIRKSRVVVVVGRRIRRSWNGRIAMREVMGSV